MLPLPLVQEIDQLLAEGKLSQRKIAKRLGVSRGTVSAIASGRRGLWGRGPQQDGDQPAGPPERCRGCGYMVIKPCLICRTREHVVQQRASRPRAEQVARRRSHNRPSSSRRAPLAKVA